MTDHSTAGIDSNLLNFDLLPDSAFVPVDALASLLGVSIATIRRRIAEGRLPAPTGILGLQRYNVGMIRNEILKSFDLISLDDPDGGMDVPLNASNYEFQHNLDEAGHGN
jgi:hypothetical protein